MAKKKSKKSAGKRDGLTDLGFPELAYVPIPIQDLFQARFVPALFIVLFVLIGTYFLTTTHAALWVPPTDQITTTGNITSAYSGYCLDDKNSNPSDGNPIDLWTCNGTDAQIWKIYSSRGTPDEGTIEIYSKCMAIAGGSTLDNTVVDLATCNGTPAQEWVWSTTQNIIQNTGSGKCLTLPKNKNTNGTQLVIYSCQPANVAQQWSLPVQAISPTPSPTPTPAPVPTPAPAPVTTTPPVSRIPEISTTSTSVPPSETPNASVNNLTPPGVNIPPTSPLATPIIPAQVISQLHVLHVSSTSAVITWQTDVASTFTLRYGTNPEQLTHTVHTTVPVLTAEVTLTHLPANHKIYLEVIPTNNGAVGTSLGASFQTKVSLSYYVIIALVVVLAVPTVLLIFKHRKPPKPPVNPNLHVTTSDAPKPSQTTPPQPAQHSPITVGQASTVLPESPDILKARSLWWVPDALKVQYAKDHISHTGKDKNDAYPDMYKEGRERLDAMNQDQTGPKIIKH